MLRWFLFLIAIGLGMAAALYLGWVVLPAQSLETSPDTLRADYKTDYVLMVAEAYSADHNVDLAVERLSSLGDRPPAALVSEALLFAARNHYTDADLALLQVLNDDLQAQNPPPESPTP